MGQSIVVPTATVHEFQKSLDYSTQESDEAFWDAIYRKAFPSLVNQMPLNGNTLSQRMGIDRILFLGNSEVIKTDEKKREKDYGDVLLEYLSNDQTNAPGWMDKDLAIDYLVYAVMPTKKVHLFPWQLLRRAWKKHRQEWIEKYFNVPAQNPGYKTFSVAVPIDVVWKAIIDESIVEA